MFKALFDYSEESIYANQSRLFSNERIFPHCTSEWRFLYLYFVIITMIQKKSHFKNLWCMFIRRKCQNFNMQCKILNIRASWSEASVNFDVNQKEGNDNVVFLGQNSPHQKIYILRNHNSYYYWHIIMCGMMGIENPIFSIKKN